MKHRGGRRRGLDAPRRLPTSNSNSDLICINTISVPHLYCHKPHKWRKLRLTRSMVNVTSCSLPSMFSDPSTVHIKEIINRLHFLLIQTHDYHGPATSQTMTEEMCAFLLPLLFSCTNQYKTEKVSSAPSPPSPPPRPTSTPRYPLR